MIPIAIPLLLCVGLGLAACGGGVGPDLGLVEDEKFAIQDPSGPAPSATGIGCGRSRREAMANAQRTAAYNLRGVIGPRPVRLRYREIGPIPDPDRTCLQVEATAFPL